MVKKPDFTEYNVIFWKKTGNIIHYPVWFLNFDSLEEDYEYIMFLGFGKTPAFDAPDIPQLVQSLETIFQQDPEVFVLLTPWKAAPLYEESDDEYMYSFSCPLPLFQQLLQGFGNRQFQSTHFLFELLDKILQGGSPFTRIITRQFPFSAAPASISHADHLSSDVIVPHRGSNSYLKGLLSHLHLLPQIDVKVGIDQDIDEETKCLIAQYPNITFFSFSPNPVGPYVIRNKLIDQSSNSLLFFQDSDDIPCADRFDQLAGYMLSKDCQLCGSHEVRMDHYSKTVQAIRYPLNVHSALAKHATHCLLHGASAITREAFYQAGKLSEERIFGNDTKFLLNSHFALDQILNMDAFLYIRRRRPDSLTTSTDQSIGSEIRYQLWRQWNRDYRQISKGKLKLEASSLTYRPSTLNFRCYKINRDQHS